MNLFGERIRIGMRGRLVQSALAFGLTLTILSGPMTFSVQVTRPRVSSRSAPVSGQNMVPPQSSSGPHTKANLNPAKISIRSVHLEGGGELSDARALVTKELKAHTYSSGDMAEISERVRHLYQDHGYIRVDVADPETARVNSTTIDVTLRLKSGPQYRLKDIQISGVKAFPPVDLRRLIPLQSGDVFNVGKLRNAFDAMRGLYQTKGYINFTPIPDQVFDETDKTVLFIVKIQEGKAFRFGPLKLSGVEAAPGVGHKILADWKPYIGQGFNIEALERFIEEQFRLPKAKVAAFYWRHVQLETDEREGIATVLLLLPSKGTQ
jgi:Surface antigen variable number repeat/POTRA domain, ShlB-type